MQAAAQGPDGDQVSKKPRHQAKQPRDESEPQEANDSNTEESEDMMPELKKAHKQADQNYKAPAAKQRVQGKALSLANALANKMSPPQIKKVPK